MTLRSFTSFSLWLGPFLSLYTASRCKSSYFFSLTWAMVGHSSALLLLSWAWVWTWAYLTSCELALHLGRGALPSMLREGAASSIGTRMIDTSQTRPLALIGCVERRILANRIMATRWLPSNHNDKPHSTINKTAWWLTAINIQF